MTVKHTPKHTPGPWRESGGIVFDDHVPGKPPLARIQSEGFPPAEAEANSRLIAAAPELLDALKAMVALAESANDASNEGGLLDERYDAALAAIAKAGEGA